MRAVAVRAISVWRGARNAQPQAVPSLTAAEVETVASV